MPLAGCLAINNNNSNNNRVRKGMLVGVLVDFSDGEKPSEDGHEEDSGFAESEDELEELVSTSCRPSIYEELSQLDYFSSKAMIREEESKGKSKSETKSEPSIYVRRLQEHLRLAACEEEERLDRMPISELIGTRSEKGIRSGGHAHCALPHPTASHAVARRAYGGDQMGWETGTQSPSVLSVGLRPAFQHQHQHYQHHAMPVMEPWVGRRVEVPPGYQLKEFLPGGSEIRGPAPRENPWQTQFEAMLRTIGKHNRQTNF